MSKIILAVSSAIFMAGALVACGSGSVSTGAAGGGGGGSAYSSSLVVQVNKDQRTAAVRAHGQNRSLAAVIGDLLVRSAVAQTAGVAIFIDGTQVAVTDDTGSAVIPLAAGTYSVCVLDPTVVANCTTVTVAPDSVVVVSDVNIDELGAVTIGSVSTELAEDNVVAFQDPNNAQKTIVCHKNPVKQFTISVGTPAALNGHLAHGDSLGACPEQVTDDTATDDIASDQNGNGNNGNGNGNNGNGNGHGNNGNNGNNGNGNGRPDNLPGKGNQKV